MGEYFDHANMACPNEGSIRREIPILKIPSNVLTLEEKDVANFYNR